VRDVRRLKRTVLLVAVAAAAGAGTALALAGAAATGRAANRAAAPPFRPGRLAPLPTCAPPSSTSSRSCRGGTASSSSCHAGSCASFATPQWSPDGRWIALADTLVPASGGAPCTPFGHGVALAWSPHGDLLAAVTKSGGLLLGGPGLPTRRLLPNGWGASGPAFDLRGRRLAVLRGSTSFIGSIWVVDSRTGRQTKVYSSPSEHVGPPIRASWSADSGWLLFQTDTERSASLAADGVPLWAVRASGGRPLMIEREVLVAPDFVRPCGRRLVVSAGFDRYVSANKHIDLAAPPAWRARDLSSDRSRSWYSAACSLNGRLVAATVTRNRAEGRFDTAERSIWLLRTDGRARRLLIGKPGDRISDEFLRWSRDGRFLLYVEPRRSPTRRRASTSSACARAAGGGRSRTSAMASATTAITSGARARPGTSRSCRFGTRARPEGRYRAFSQATRTGAPAASPASAT
jgi:hypothetical protein